MIMVQQNVVSILLFDYRLQHLRPNTPLHSIVAWDVYVGYKGWLTVERQYLKPGSRYKASYLLCF